MFNRGTKYHRNRSFSKDIGGVGFSRRAINFENTWEGRIINVSALRLWAEKMFSSDERYGCRCAFSRETNLRAITFTSSKPSATISTQTYADFLLSRKTLLGNLLDNTKSLKKNFLGHWFPLFIENWSTFMLFLLASNNNCNLFCIS